MGDVVVGVDGSAASVEALRFAAHEASLRGGRVRAVCAWAYPPVGILPLSADPVLPRQLARHAAETVEKALSDSGIDRASVDVVVGEGSPASVLLYEAGTAELVVVGARGVGGFHGLLLGSVSQQLAQHAPCPVVIVRLGVAA